MTPRWLVMGLLTLASARVQGGEAWHELHATAEKKVAVDLASLRRDGKRVSFRERHVLLKAEVDPESLRRIAEIQYRRQADCGRQRLVSLSRAMFSDADGLVRYEATRPERGAGAPPWSEEEARVYQWACGEQARR